MNQNIYKYNFVFSSSAEEYLKTLFSNNHEKFKCEMCNISFDHKESLENHMKIAHTNPEMHILNISDSTPKINANQVLKNFFETVKTPIPLNSEKFGKNEINVKKCDYLTTKSDDLMNHVKNVHMKKVTQIIENNQSLKVKKSVKKSSNSNSGPSKSYQCHLCPYSGARRVHLQSHINYKHKLERPFKCEQCDFKAVHKSKLMKHIKDGNHWKNDKLLNCSKCAFFTYKKLEYLNHVSSAHYQNEDSIAVESQNSDEEIIETIEEFHVCNQCDFYTNQKNQLEAHIQSNHSKNQENQADFLKCDKCDYLTTTKGNLISHKEKKHKKVEIIDLSDNCEPKIENDVEILEKYDGIILDHDIIELDDPLM